MSNKLQRRYQATRVPLHLCMHTSCLCARNKGRCPQISLLSGLSTQPEAITSFHRWRHKRGGSAPAANLARGATSSRPVPAQGGDRTPASGAQPVMQKHPLGWINATTLPQTHHTFPHRWPLLLHHGHRQPAPEICFAGGAPRSPRTPPPGNQIREVGLQDGLASPMHAGPCMSGPCRALLSLHQEINHHQLHFCQREGIFFPRSSLGRGQSAEVGQESSARGRF